eukprot:TRINITY_DN70487_c0_g1_i1.p1 TRINITY_DN70487_c0_g1~~TRINITY_DN70487_c0_g1_i1.p1  ORF type:complete len:515 (+),score=82.39 TRINITY_DN70487_c0_g1_i1:59-1603(+)
MARKPVKLGNLLKVTTGVSNDYFAKLELETLPNDDCWDRVDRQVMRLCLPLEDPGSVLKHQSTKECIQAMQRGFPVSFFCSRTNNFSPCILKTDDCVMFLMLLTVHDDKELPRFCCLSDVDQVFSGGEAEDLCRHYNVHSEEFNFNSVVVVHLKTCADQDKVPELGDLMIFVAARHARLGEKIKACIGSVARSKIRSGKYSMIAFHTGSTNHHSATEDVFATQSAKALNLVRLKDPWAVLCPNNKIIDFEIIVEESEMFSITKTSKALRIAHVDRQDSPNSTHSFLHCVTLPLNLKEKPTISEATRAQKRTGVRFGKVDLARLDLYFSDMVAVRLWAEQLAAQAVFGVIGLSKFLQEEDTLCAMLADDIKMAKKQADVPAKGYFGNNDCGSVFDAGAKSSCKALKNLIDLELNFGELLKNGYSLGVVEKMPLRFTLAGDLLSPLEMEESESDTMSQDSHECLQGDQPNCNKPPSEEKRRRSSAASIVPIADRDATRPATAMPGYLGVPCFSPRS